MARSTPTACGRSLKGGALATINAPSSDGDIIDAGSTLLVIAGATPTDVTVVPVGGDYAGLTLENAGGTVAANTARRFGPFGANVFAQPSDAVTGAGKVLVNYSSVATITRLVEAG